jgi:6-pyruvoyltetrahydropterin/6-carboxytetrahydropterin synthase
VDFGGLKPLKTWLAEMFDHTYLAAEDDPEMETIIMLRDKGLIDLRIVTATGCERFAEMAFDKAQEIVSELTDGRCWVQSVTVREHGHNSATVELADTQKIRFIENVQ